MVENSKVWYLEAVDLHEILCSENHKRLKKHFNFTIFNKNDFIYKDDEPANHIYLISEGRVKIGNYIEDGREAVKSIHYPGEIFGELALAGEDRRSDFAQAMDNNTKLCPLSTENMENLMTSNAELRQKIYKLIGMRLKKLELKLESFIFRDARTRIIDFLKDTAVWSGKKIGYEMMIASRLTHKDIASLTGTSRQTVTTILNELRDQNIINFDRKKILIRDLEKLK